MRWVFFLAVAAAALLGCQEKSKFSLRVSVPAVMQAALPEEGELGIWVVDLEGENLDLAREKISITPHLALSRGGKGNFPDIIRLDSIKLEKGKRYFLRVVYSRALHIRRDVDQASAELAFTYEPSSKPLEISFTEFRPGKRLDLASPTLLSGSLRYHPNFPKGEKFVLAAFAAVGKFTDGRPGLNSHGALLAADWVEGRPEKFVLKRSTMLEPLFHGRIELYLIDCEAKADAAACAKERHKNRAREKEKIFPAYSLNLVTLDSGETGRELVVLPAYDFYQKQELR